MPLSHLSETLIGSEIINLAADIREKIAQGQKIYNYTIGDFDPEIFPIPREFEEAIIRSYRERNTNYPPANGLPELREAVSALIRDWEKMDYDPEQEILISAGGRPLIYAVYRAIVDKDEKVIYPVPSWNNNHYTHFVGGKHAPIETTPESNFMPTAAALKPMLPGAVLLALCSPLNPTGTAFSREQLMKICDLVWEENKRRASDEKKLFILFDQIYWQLTFEETRHYHPVALKPELKKYTIYIDGMSKAFASTGVRVGWAMGPAEVMGKMKTILSHIGAWSPRAVQKAASRYLSLREPITDFLMNFKWEIHERLQLIYEGFMALKKVGYAVDAIAPQAAIYLTIKIDLKGKKTAQGVVLKDQADVTAYILDQAGLAIVPFYAFGASKESSWYRLSVGTCKIHEIDEMLDSLEAALKSLQS